MSPIEHMMELVQVLISKDKQGTQMFLSLKTGDMCFTLQITMFSLVMPIIWIMAKDHIEEVRNWVEVMINKLILKL